MAGQDDQLRLAATVVDRFSGPLKDMQRSLRALSAETTRTHKQGRKDTEQHTHAVKQLRESYGKITADLKELTGPALVGLGIAGLSAAGGIAATVSAVRNLATTIPQLQYLSRQTGMSVNQLRLWQQYAEESGSSAGAMSAGVVALSDHMDRLRRNVPAEIAAFDHYGDAIKNFARSIQDLPRDDQLRKVLAFANGAPTGNVRREVLQAFGLPIEMANENLVQMGKHLDETRKRLRQFTDDDLRRADQLKKAYEDLSLTTQRLRDDLAIGLAPAFSKVADEVGDFLAGHEKDLMRSLNELSDWIRSGGLDRMAASIKGIASAVDGTVTEFSSWTTVIELLVGLRLAAWVGGVTRDLAGLRLVLVPVAALLGTTVSALAGIGAGAAAGAAEAYAGWAHWGAVIDAVSTKLGVTQGKVEEFVRFMAGIPLIGAPFAAFLGGHLAHQGASWLATPGGADKDAIERGAHAGILSGLREWFSQNMPTLGPGVAATAAAAAALPFAGSGLAVSAARAAGALPAPSGRGLSSGQKATAANLMAGLQARGFSREQAAAVVGNLTAESGLRPGVVNSIGATGLEQLLGARKKGFLNYARSIGRPWQDIGAQLDWLKMERSGESTRYGGTDERTAFARALNGSDVAQMAARFGALVERPSMVELRGSLRRREQAAIEAFHLHERISDDALMQRAARTAGMGFGMAAQAIEGNASLSIDFQNMPRGVRTSAAASGLFREVRLNRGIEMPLASDVG